MGCRSSAVSLHIFCRQLYGVVMLTVITPTTIQGEVSTMAVCRSADFALDRVSILRPRAVICG